MSFLCRYLDVGLVELFDDCCVCSCGFFVGLATHKDVVRDLAAFSLREFLLDDFGEEFFEFFGLA